MPRKNEWLSRFGAKRKALDKAYCAAAEAAIVGNSIPDRVNVAPASVNVAPASVNVAPASVNVAPASVWQAELEALQNARRLELALLTGKNIRTI